MNWVTPTEYFQKLDKKFHFTKKRRLIMDRLTERDEFGNTNIIGVDRTDLELNLRFKDFYKVKEALDKLAEYEDLEAQEKIPLLHAGATIHFIVFGNNPKSGKYEDYIYSEEIISCYITKDFLHYTTESKGFTNSDIGKAIFLTESEAEAALKNKKRS